MRHRLLATVSYPALVTGVWERVHFLQPSRPGVHVIDGYATDGTVTTEHLVADSSGVAWSRGSYASVVYRGVRP